MKTVASLNVLEWLNLPDIEKQDYTCRYYPSDTSSEYDEHDCGVFTTPYIHEVSMQCETCFAEDTIHTIKHDVLYGTRDSREPKYCALHWTQMNLGRKTISKFYIPETEEVVYFHIKSFQGNVYWHSGNGWVKNKLFASRYTRHDQMDANVYPINGAWERVGGK